ncbi:MAG: tRNA (N(6)-L-threonylcarbamoyladenosine(37)-C(2))-methylthiotransferase MtaB [Acidobacteria bacterium]|nr:tRNA (N(6)-L-threonylcarbamoyladenosine(37)-C(2))-methylthiotransferase MtaB [Acidobacteriota bacterium]
MSKGRYFIKTLGCKLNQYDQAAMEEQLREMGFVPSSSSEADLIIVNTCTVTGKADAEARRLIRSYHRENKKARIMVTGCYPEREPELFTDMPEVSLVFGNYEKYHLAEAVRFLNEGRGKLFRLERERGGSTPVLPLTSFSGHTRAFVKIQEGCDANCSYCIVPKVRGKSRSVPLSLVIREVESLLSQGFSEIVLTGIHIGVYGRDFGEEKGFLTLLRAIVELPYQFRVRLSSLEPLEITPELIQFVARSEKIAPHFHIPLQSGSDRILAKMRRPYRRDKYREVVLAIRELIPDAGIGADVIVGFPGEEEEDFMATYRLIEELPLTHLHIFSFSPRPGTEAFHMKPALPKTVIKERVKKLRTLAKEKMLAFRQGFIGRELSSVVLSKRDEEGRLVALSGNYIPIKVPYEPSFIGRIVPVRIVELNDKGVFGIISSSATKERKEGLKVEKG